MKYKNKVCKGDKSLGTACGHCERCLEEKEKVTKKTIREIVLSMPDSTTKKELVDKLKEYGYTEDDFIKFFMTLSLL